jgi:hypothetical protein
MGGVRLFTVSPTSAILSYNFKEIKLALTGNARSRRKQSARSIPTGGGSFHLRSKAHGFVDWYSIWRTVSSAQVRQKLAKCARPLQLNSLVGDWYESKVCISCLKLNLCSTPDVPEKAGSALSWQLIASGLIAADTKGGFR